MKFVNKAGVRSKARRFVSTFRSFAADDLADPTKLAEIFRNLFNQVSAVEARVAPEASEYEVDVSTAGATVSIQHNFACPVRWYVTDWTGGSAGPSLVRSTASTNKVLVLASYVAGTAIVRVEPVQG